MAEKKTRHIILTTVLILVSNVVTICTAHALLVGYGSQINIIANSLANKSKLKIKNSNIVVSGLSGINEIISSSIKGATNLNIASRISHYNKNLDCIIMEKIVSKMPTCNHVTNWNIPQSCLLADPNYDTIGEIDLISEVEIVFEILKNEQIKLTYLRGYSSVEQ